MSKLFGGVGARHTLVLALVFGVGWSAAAPAQTTVQAAREFVRLLGDSVIDVLKDGSLDSGGRKTALHGLFLRSFDSARMARFTLGRYWRTANADQRARYMKVFPSYVADIYAGRLSKYEGETFVILKARAVDGKRAFVNAEVRRPDGSALKVDFRVRSGPQGLKNTDVLVERISLLVTKRDEFSSVIRRSSLDRLIASLESRAGQ